MMINKRFMNKVTVLAALIFTLVTCSRQDSDEAAADETFSTSSPNAVAEIVAVGDRWYGNSELELGKTVFAQHCASCHGVEAQGIVADWRQRLDNGKFPAPPLNGSAHAWHHPLSVLLQQIENGGEYVGGSMPSFADILSQQEKRAAVAFFQNFWTAEIYQQWQTIDQN